MTRVHQPKPLLVALIALGAATALSAQPADQQIAAAVLAAPEEFRDGARVLGWRDGDLVELRAGSNPLICLADDPEQKGFSAACYHESLEPFMARGRELQTQGITGRERAEKRMAEVEAGTLPMPRDGRMLYVLSGESYDPATGTVAKSSLRWVIYVPFATAESTGLSTTPMRGAPWLMGAGTAGAHIMITPES